MTRHGNPLAHGTGTVVEIGRARLIFGDAYAILPTLGHFDALVTDPPYLLRTAGGGRFRKDRRQLDAIRDQGLDRGFDHAAIINPLLYGSATVFCHTDQLPQLLPYIAGVYHRFALLTWRKANPLPVANQHYRPDSEHWLHGWARGYAPTGTLEQKSRWWDGGAPHGDDRHGHPTPKPLGLMEKIIANTAGNSVVDPFMGTGTTGVAAIRAGRDFTGIEHNWAHFQTACRRIEAAVKGKEEA
jgi:DNA modification methylase